MYLPHPSVAAVMLADHAACAHEDFEAATAEQAAAQKAWMAWRTAQSPVYWSCVTRQTRERNRAIACPVRQP